MNTMNCLLVKEAMNKHQLIIKYLVNSRLFMGYLETYSWLVKTWMHFQSKTHAGFQ